MTGIVPLAIAPTASMPSQTLHRAVMPMAPVATALLACWPQYLSARFTLQAANFMNTASAIRAAPLTRRSPKPCPRLSSLFVP